MGHISLSGGCSEDFFSAVATHKITQIGSALCKMLHILRWRRESVICVGVEICLFSCVQMGVSKAEASELADVVTEHLPNVRCWI